MRGGFLASLVGGSVLVCAGSAFAQTKKIMVIAHRGGVVDESHSENSLSSMEEAIRRGYTHVEVDVRLTKDGRVVCFHSDNMKAQTGVDRNISDLTLTEVRKAVLTRSNEQIPTFEEYCARIANRINLMVDIKGTSDRFLEFYAKQIEHALVAHGLLAHTLFIINQFPIANQEKVAEYFLGKALLSWRSDVQYTRLMLPYMPSPAKYRFVFNSPAELTKPEIDGFHEMGIPIVASVNTQDYRGPTADPLKQGNEDINKMLDWGVDGVQIDSCYDPPVFERLKKR
jgi:glycerophosphoryl diester phosphodiesterase